MGRIVFLLLAGLCIWLCAVAVSKFVNPGQGQKISVTDEERIQGFVCPNLSTYIFAISLVLLHSHIYQLSSFDKFEAKC